MNRLLVGAVALALGSWTAGTYAEDTKPAPGKGPAAGQFRQKLLEKFDKNGDGKLDAEELKAAREEFQKNGGPKLGPQGEELKKKLLEKFDKNGDGKLDADELKAAREEMQKRRGGPGQPGPGGRRFGPKPPAPEKT